MAKSSSALLRIVPPDPPPSPIEGIQKALARAHRELASLTEKLEEARIDAELLRRFEDALVEIQHAERSLDEQLVLERINRQQLKVHLQSLDLLRFATEVAHAAAPLCRKERKPLCLEVSGSVQVMADADLLQRAIQGLLGCALAHGLPKKSVVLDVEEDEQNVRLTFVAQGCDHDKKACPCGEHLVGIEERLAFTRQLAAAQNAQVEITHAYELGVCFALVLPKSVPEAQELPTFPSCEIQIVED